MSKQIFINLPVADVARATAFYAALGFEQNAMFSNAVASAMVWSDSIAFMLLEPGSFGNFTSKRIADAKTEAQALFCLSAESRDAVDAMIATAAAAGGRADPDPGQDQGFMYGRSYEDPDGHLFEVMWMDLDAAKAAMSA